MGRGGGGGGGDTHLLLALRGHLTTDHISCSRRNCGGQALTHLFRCSCCQARQGDEEDLSYVLKNDSKTDFILCAIRDLSNLSKDIQRVIFLFVGSMLPWIRSYVMPQRPLIAA